MPRTTSCDLQEIDKCFIDYPNSFFLSEEVLIVSCTSLQMFYVILSKIVCFAVVSSAHFRFASAKVRTSTVLAKEKGEKVWGNFRGNFPCGWLMVCASDFCLFNLFSSFLALFGGWKGKCCFLASECGAARCGSVCKDGGFLWGSQGISGENWGNMLKNMFSGGFTAKGVLALGRCFFTTKRLLGLRRCFFTTKGHEGTRSLAVEILSAKGR